MAVAGETHFGFAALIWFRLAWVGQSLGVEDRKLWGVVLWWSCLVSVLTRIVSRLTSIRERRCVHSMSGLI